MKHEKKILHFASLGQVCNTDIFGTSIFFFLFSQNDCIGPKPHATRGTCFSNWLNYYQLNITR